MKTEETLLTDVGQCRPRNVLSLKARPGHWQLITYKTNEVSGTMVFARGETGAPEITLPLKVQGWHAIYLAFMGQLFGEEPLLKVKLSNDPCFVQVETDADHPYIEEGFWKIADLTGQNLVIAQRTGGEARCANLAYVRLVPLRKEEMKRQKDRSGTRKLIAMNDHWSFYFSKGSCSVQDLQGEIEPYRDTDFKKIFWEMWSGDTSTYLAKVGALFGQETEDFYRSGERRVAKCMQEMKKLELNPLEVALKYAHEMGLEFYASMRMGFFGMCPPEEFYEGPFFRDHPEFRCRDYDGTEVSHLSYAFPEVRRYVLTLLEDTASYDIDGINLIFIRGYPYLLYEKPLVEGFQGESGIDPTTLIEKDSQWNRATATMEKLTTKRNQAGVAPLNELSGPVQNWLRYRARSLTEFMRELQCLLKQIGKEQKISAVVFANEVGNLFYGIDVETWAREGLVDIIVPHPYHNPYLEKESGELDMGFFRRITKGNGCQLYPNVMPRRMEPKEYLKKALSYYEKGADGLSFWDTNDRHRSLSQWQAVRELGHKEELSKWLKSERFPGKLLLVRQLGQYTVDRYHPRSGA